MTQLSESISRCLNAASEELTRPLPPPRPRKVVSPEEFDRCAEATADIAGQVGEELARMGLGSGSSERPPKLHGLRVRLRAA
jgi:hypothetical protein